MVEKLRKVRRRCIPLFHVAPKAGLGPDLWRLRRLQTALAGAGMGVDLDVVLDRVGLV